MDAGSLAVAKGLCTTGGMIAAFPSLAPLVLIADVVGARAFSELSKDSVSKRDDDVKKSIERCKDIEMTLTSVKDMTSFLQTFAGKLNDECAFFASIAFKRCSL